MHKWDLLSGGDRGVGCLLAHQKDTLANTHMDRLTKLSDQKKLMSCYKTEYPFSFDWDLIIYLFEVLVAEIKQRTSMYKRKGQIQQWLYLCGQVQPILNRSHKTSQTFQRLDINDVGLNDYHFDDIEELVALSIGRKSYWQAELILEETASHLRDQPWKKEFIWYLDKLVELYIQSVERAKSMLNEALDSEEDVEEVASLLILDRAARIDFDALSNRLINKHLINLERPNLAATLYFAAVHGACNLARLTLDEASLSGTSFSRDLVSGIESQDRVFRFRTPLHLAVGFGYNEMVRLLVTRGADVEAKGYGGYATEEVPLHVAVEQGRLSIVIYLLSLHANIEARSDFKETPLIMAASSRDPDIVRYLLERGARVDPVDHYGQTALHHAAEGWRSANIRLILAFGADIMARTVDGRTALHLAVDNYPAAVDDSCPNMIEAINVLLNNAADLDAKDRNMQTALHQASHRGNVFAAEHLISRGASISTVGRFGTPLHCAVGPFAVGDQLSTVETLLRNSAEVNKQRSLDGSTPLHLAVRDCARELNVETIQALCQSGADATIRDNKSKSAFDYAGGNEAATAVLMQYRVFDGTCRMAFG